MYKRKGGDSYMYILTVTNKMSAGLVVLCRTRLGARYGARRVQAWGIFPGAVVVRGADWRWEDQDGEWQCSATLVGGCCNPLACCACRAWTLSKQYWHCLS